MKHLYVTKRAGTANLHYHRQIPEALQGVLGRKQYWKSLGTPAYREACRRTAKVSVAFDKMVADAEKQLELQASKQQLDELLRRHCDSKAGEAGEQALSEAARPFISGAPPAAVLEEQHVPALSRRHYALALKTDDDERLGMTNAEVIERRAFMADAHEQLSLANAASRYEEMCETVDTLLEAENLHADHTSQAYQLLLITLLQTDLSVVAEQLARLQGRGTKSPDGIPPLPADCDNWPAMLDAWRKKRSPVPKSFDETKRSAERFQTLTGSPPVPQICVGHVETFKEKLNEEGVTKSRVNTILGLLRAVVFVAMKEGKTTLTANPFHGRQHSAKAVAQDRLDKGSKVRNAILAPDLNVLYRSRVYVSDYRPAKGGGDAAFWMPLLDTFCGGRLEDIGCLTVADFREFDGVHFIELGDKKRSGASTSRSTYRKIPIHEELHKIGILEYVEIVARRAGTRKGVPLFPDLKPDSYGKFTKVWSTWFNEYIDSIGLDDSSLDFQSFRHSFQHFAELSGLDGPVIDAIVGHAPNMSKMGNRYGLKDADSGVKALPFESIVKAMRAFHIPGLDLSHLYGKWKR